MIQGLNITVEIQRSAAGANDSVGGRTSTTTTIATGVRARISAVKPSVEVRAQGLETNKMFNMSVWPATTDIQQNDLVIPESGQHSGKTFQVRGVQMDSISTSDPRSHLSVRLERPEAARSSF